MAHRRRRAYEDQGARTSILAGAAAPRPDTLTQTGQIVSHKLLADGAGHTFFEQAVLQHEFGNHLFQCAGLPAQVPDLVRGCRPRGVAGQAFLASLQKLLRPAVIEVLDDPCAATQLSDTVFAARTAQHDADLLLRRKLTPGGAADLLRALFRRLLHRPGLRSHLRSFNGYD